MGNVIIGKRIMISTKLTKIIKSGTAAETQQTGVNLAQHIITSDIRRSKAFVVCLYGELGSGTTTFAQGFVRPFGFSGRLLSPTFIIVRRYDAKIFPEIFHIDLYRISKTSELEAIGISEILDNPDNLVIIEWAEKLENRLPVQRIDIRFSIDHSDMHIININDFR
jgi:tRNA threonylcarbamoyladenosine biosynthesis protein TsaE